MSDQMNRPMVNQIPDAGPVNINAPELAEDIVAQPLVAPDFMNPIPKNPNIEFRWIEFKARDGFRFHQCLTQGFAVATVADLKNPDQFKMYMREGGTKFINGDIILMKIDRARYLGAKKHRYLKTQALTNPEVVKAVAAAAGQADLVGSRGRMSTFVPGAAPTVPLSELGVDVTKIPGIGGVPKPEMKSGTDVRSEQFKSQEKGDK